MCSIWFGSEVQEIQKRKEKNHLIFINFGVKNSTLKITPKKIKN
jgi:hypothetical protein